MFGPTGYRWKRLFRSQHWTRGECDEDSTWKKMRHDKTEINLQHLRQDKKDPQRRWLDVFGDVDPEDAVFIVDMLQQILLHEQQLTDNNNNKTRTTRRTGLYLSCPNLHEKTVEVFEHFLQDTTRLSALHLHFIEGEIQPPSYRCAFHCEHYRRLLKALYTNMSVEELSLTCNRGFSATASDHDVDGWIAKLLENKNDFTAIRFGGDRFFLASFIQTLRSGSLPRNHLRKLGFHDCRLFDQHIESLIQALVDGDLHRCLEELDLSKNCITSSGLRSLCALNPSTFPSLQKLTLNGNDILIDNEEITRRFVQELLLSDETTLKELHIAHCALFPVRYTLFIKALETNQQLRLLNMSNCTDFADIVDGEPDIFDDQQPIREQLVESLPQMKGLGYLIAAQLFLNEHDQELMTAFDKNTSLVRISVPTTSLIINHDARSEISTPILLTILKRNNYFTQLLPVASLLRTTTKPNATTTTPTTTIPSSLWTRVLATVGKGSEGSSVVLFILQEQLANWPETKTRSSSSSSTDSSSSMKKDSGNQLPWGHRFFQSSSPKVLVGSSCGNKNFIVYL